MPQALCGWTPLPFSTGLGFFDSWTRFKKAFLMGSGGRGWGWSHYFCHFPSCEPRCRPAAPRGPELTALSFFSSLSSGRLPAPAPSRLFCVCKVKVLLGYKLRWFRDSDERHKISRRSIRLGMGSSGHGEGRGGTFPGSSAELVRQLTCLLQAQPTSIPESPSSAAIKTSDGLCRSTAFEVFSSRPARNARVVLTMTAGQLRAYPTAKASRVDFPSRREHGWVRKEELRVLDPALRTASSSLVEKDIRKTRGEGHYSYSQHWSGASHPSCSVSEETSHPRTPAWAITVRFTPCSVRSRAGEAGRWSTRNHDAWDVPLGNSRQQEVGHCTAHFGTYFETPNPPQGLKQHPKALTQSLGLRSGRQTSAGVVPFNL